MKKIIRKICIFLLPVVLLGLIFEVMLRRIPNEYKYKREYMEQHADSINVLFLGSSHAYLGINPKYMSANSFNAAISSQSFDYDLLILQKFDKQLTHLKYIVLPISYFSLFTNLSEASESWRIKFYMIYFQLHSSSKLTNYTEILSGSLELNLKRLILYYVRNRKEVGCSDLGWQIPFGKIEDVAATGFEGAKKHTNKNRALYEVQKGILQQIISIAKQKNAVVLFYTPPAYNTYYNNVDTAQLSLTMNTATALVKQNDNTYYHSFLKDSSFDIHDFYDGDHLNGAGAEKLTKKMDSLIRSIDKEKHLLK
jgi:hypothetical protein